MGNTAKCLSKQHNKYTKKKKRVTASEHASLPELFIVSVVVFLELCALLSLIEERRVDAEIRTDFMHLIVAVLWDIMRKK